MEQMTLEKKLVKRKQLCEILSLGANTFYSLATLPGFPRIKITEQLHLYDPDDVSKFLKDRTQNGEVIF